MRGKVMNRLLVLAGVVLVCLVALGAAMAARPLEDAAGQEQAIEDELHAISDLEQARLCEHTARRSFKANLKEFKKGARQLELKYTALIADGMTLTAQDDDLSRLSALLDRVGTDWDRFRQVYKEYVDKAASMEAAPKLTNYFKLSGVSEDFSKNQRLYTLFTFDSPGEEQPDVDTLQNLFVLAVDARRNLSEAESRLQSLEASQPG